MTSLSNAQNSNEKTAQVVFNAWEKGENTGNYNDFKKFLSADFSAFSHPLLGNYSEKKALDQIKGLIAEREINSNQLIFTEIQMINNNNQYVFLFNSRGSVAGGFSYEGFNAIVLTVVENKLTSFREYFGFIDPNWFKK